MAELFCFKIVMSIPSLTLHEIIVLIIFMQCGIICEWDSSQNLLRLPCWFFLISTKWQLHTQQLQRVCVPGKFKTRESKRQTNHVMWASTGHLLPTLRHVASCAKRVDTKPGINQKLFLFQKEIRTFHFLLN